MDYITMNIVFLVECYFSNIISFLQPSDNINLLLSSKSINQYTINDLLWERQSKLYLNTPRISRPGWVKSYYKLYTIYCILNEKRSTCPVCSNKEDDDKYFLLLCKCYKKNKDIILSNGTRVCNLHYILHHKKCIEGILNKKLTKTHSINNKCIYCSQQIFYFPVKSIN